MYNFETMTETLLLHTIHYTNNFETSRSDVLIVRDHQHKSFKNFPHKIFSWRVEAFLTLTTGDFRFANFSKFFSKISSPAPSMEYFRVQHLQNFLSWSLNCASFLLFIDASILTKYCKTFSVFRSAFTLMRPLLAGLVSSWKNTGPFPSPITRYVTGCGKKTRRHDFFRLPSTQSFQNISFYRFDRLLWEMATDSLGGHRWLFCYARHPQQPRNPVTTVKSRYNRLSTWWTSFYKWLFISSDFR